MLKHLAIGAGLAFAAAVQPGPFQAYLFSRVTAIGWRRTLPAAFAPLLSDGPIALLALLVLGQLSPTRLGILRGAGGLLLLYLALNTFLRWRLWDELAVEPDGKVPRTLLEATLVNFLNPNPWLGWALILGPAATAAWQETPAAGVGVVVSFYATMIGATIGLIYVFGGARVFGQRFQRALLLFSSLVLAGLGAYQLVLAMRQIWADGASFDFVLICSWPSL